MERNLSEQVQNLLKQHLTIKEIALHLGISEWKVVELLPRGKKK